MRISALLLILLSPIALHASTALRNELVGHPSPYLAMHGNDPVHWQSWGAKAIGAARQSNKLMFISSGYFSCYWCHVMQQESYQDQGIAALLNEAFIPIKVDRELEPVLDAHLMEFITETRGQGGWPLNVFMTPEGNALVGVLYMPPEQFREFINRLDVRWKKEHFRLKEVAAEAAKIIGQKHREDQHLRENANIPELEQAFISQSMLLADEMSGGFGQTVKFPSAPQLIALLTVYRKNPEHRLKEFLLLTLQQMADKGLRDQLSGGFFRYATDPLWRIPHFEKMLYDNALMAEVYLLAGEVFSRPDYERLGFNTIDFMLQEMITEGGAFVAALSAVDEKGREGAYYLWNPEELTKILNQQELRVVQLAWGISVPSEWEAGYLPISVIPTDEIAANIGLSVTAVEKTLRESKQKLLARRKRRYLPKDTKCLTSWNGLALSALAHAAKRNPERYTYAAQRLRDFIITSLWTKQGLHRAIDNNGQSLGPGTLEDYAYTAHGLLAWSKLNGKPRDYELAVELAVLAWRRFYSVQGWQLTDSGLIPYQYAQNHIPDSPLPSPSATLLRISLELIDRPMMAPYRQHIRNNLKRVSRSLTSQPFAHATHVTVLSRYAENRTEISKSPNRD